MSLTEKIMEFGKYQLGPREWPSFINFYSNAWRRTPKYIGEVVTRREVNQASDVTIRYAGTIAELAFALYELLSYSIGTRQGVQAFRNIATITVATEALKYIIHILISKDLDYEPLPRFPGGIRGLRKIRKEFKKRIEDETHKPREDKKYD